MAAEAILTLNAGSSSLKAQVLARGDLRPLARGAVERIGAAAVLKVEGAAPRTLAPGADHAAALAALLPALGSWEIAAVAHRVVHGGDRAEAARITPALLGEIEALVPLAPLHQPHALAGIRAAETLGVPQVACFDTAFHATREPLLARYAIPAALHAEGVRPFGFHGLSYAALARRLGDERSDLRRVVAAHLGNGASLCALRDGRSVATTMGMTPLDGVPMGTRSGAIDPGAVLHLARAHGLEAAERMLTRESGLLGLSGISNDVALLLADGSEPARFALDHFALRVAQAAAGLAVVMGGIDALAFTGGIGENAAPVREAVVARLRFLGTLEVLVVPAEEEREMARLARDLL